MTTSAVIVAIEEMAYRTVSSLENTSPARMLMARAPSEHPTPRPAYMHQTFWVRHGLCKTVLAFRSDGSQVGALPYSVHAVDTAAIVPEKDGAAGRR